MTTFQITDEQRTFLKIFQEVLYDDRLTPEERTIEHVVDKIEDAVAEGRLPSEVTVSTGSTTDSIDATEYMQEILLSNAALVTNGPVNSTTSRQIELYDGYSLILEFLSVTGTNGYALRDSKGNPLEPLPTVDEFTWIFLQGARATNLNANEFQGEEDNSAFGVLGLAYNNAQLKLRYGEEAPSPEDSRIASNDIARAILQTTIDEADEGRAFPSLFHFGIADGLEGTGDLWFGPERDDPGPRGWGSDIGGWAGNPFFAMLNEPKFFFRDVLHYKSDNPNAAPHETQNFSVETDKSSIVYQNTTCLTSAPMGQFRLI